MWKQAESDADSEFKSEDVSVHRAARMQKSKTFIKSVARAAVRCSPRAMTRFRNPAPSDRIEVYGGSGLQIKCYSAQATFPHLSDFPTEKSCQSTTLSVESSAAKPGTTYVSQRQAT